MRRNTTPLDESEILSFLEQVQRERREKAGVKDTAAEVVPEPVSVPEEMPSAENDADKSSDSPAPIAGSTIGVPIEESSVPDVGSVAGHTSVTEEVSSEEIDVDRTPDIPFPAVEAKSELAVEDDFSMHGGAEPEATDETDADMRPAGVPQVEIHDVLPDIDPVTEPKEPVAEVGHTDAEPVSVPTQPEGTKGEETEHPEAVAGPEKRNWWEVKRETEVMAIEDLDGSMDIFREHVSRLGVAEEGSDGSWKWTGGNRRLVFLGDILGDRNPNGIEITLAVGNLAEQAERAGGQVDFICGNHDMLFVHFLCHDFKDAYLRKESISFIDQCRGILELLFSDPDPNPKLQHATWDDWNGRLAKELLPLLNTRMPAILENLRTDPEGRKLLENICNLKVAVVHDDALYCHTDPTGAMIADLTKDGDMAGRAAEINAIFREGLRKKIFEGEPFSDGFRAISGVYLQADNRTYFTEEATIADDLLQKRFYMNMSESEVEKTVDEWKEVHGLTGEYASLFKSIFVDINAGNMERARKRARDIVDGIVLEQVEKIRTSGINSIIHGHSQTPNRYYDANDLVIVSPHSRFRIGGTNFDSGILTVKKDGKIEMIGRSFREKRPKEKRYTTGNPGRKRNR